MFNQSTRKYGFKVVYSEWYDLCFDTLSSPEYIKATEDMSIIDRLNYDKTMKDIWMYCEPIENVLFDSEETAIRYLSNYLAGVLYEADSYEDCYGYLEPVHLKVDHVTRNGTPVQWRYEADNGSVVIDLKCVNYKFICD